MVTAARRSVTVPTDRVKVTEDYRTPFKIPGMINRISVLTFLTLLG